MSHNERQQAPNFNISRAGTTVFVVHDSSPPKRSHKKKRPNGKPKRPLSAYNFFFRDEHQVILEEQETGAKRREFGNDDQKVSSISSTVTQIDDADNTADHDDHTPGGDEADATHSTDTMSFQILTKLIAQRWSVIDPERRKIYDAMAQMDSERYSIEMDTYEESLRNRSMFHQTQQSFRPPSVAPHNALAIQNLGQSQIYPIMNNINGQEYFGHSLFGVGGFYVGGIASSAPSAGPQYHLPPYGAMNQSPMVGVPFVGERTDSPMIRRSNTSTFTNQQLSNNPRNDSVTPSSIYSNPFIVQHNLNGVHYSANPALSIGPNGNGVNNSNTFGGIFQNRDNQYPDDQTLDFQNDHRMNLQRVQHSLRGHENQRSILRNDRQELQGQQGGRERVGSDHDDDQELLRLSQLLLSITPTTQEERECLFIQLEHLYRINKSRGLEIHLKLMELIQDLRWRNY